MWVKRPVKSPACGPRRECLAAADGLRLRERLAVQQGRLLGFAHHEGIALRVLPVLVPHA
jgi:hypothetical protein